MLNKHVNFFMATQVQLKILHWQTKGLARHEAFGKTYDLLDDLIDEFLEVAMGKMGRFHLDNETDTIKMENLNTIDLNSFVGGVKQRLIEFTKEYSKDKDTDLLNLRDEMLAKINKLQYLLTLE